MATINIQKLQANLMSDTQTGNKQVLESTIMQALPVMFGEMPSTQFTNQTGSSDAAGNITYYKTKIQQNNIKNFGQVGDISRFKNVETEKVLVALDIVIENPVTYYSSELAMSADGILAQTETGMMMNMAETREISILQAEWDTANANAATQVKEINLATATAAELDALLSDAVVQIRKTKDVGINKVSMNRIVIKVEPAFYRKLLDVKLIIPGNTQNEQVFTSGTFNQSKYKGVTIVEDVYMEDANPNFIGSVTMIGAIASPWRSEGVANQLAPGESTIYLLNPQVRYKTKAIYEKHIIAIKNTATEGTPVIGDVVNMNRIDATTATFDVTTVSNGATITTNTIASSIGTPDPLEMVLDGTTTVTVTGLTDGNTATVTLTLNGVVKTAIIPVNETVAAAPEVKEKTPDGKL